jgi:hypothetical protein
MSYATLGRTIVTLGFCLSGLIVIVFGISIPVLTLAAACFAVSVWLPWQLGLRPAEASARDYELELLARLDARNPEVHHQAENERDMQEWQKPH